MIEGKEIESDIEENLVFSDIDGKEENIWTLLLFSGYLKWIERKSIRGYKLKVPNQEVMSFYRYTVKNILKDKNIELKSMLELLLKGQIKQFKKDFKKLTRETLSYFDTQENEPERFYHGLMLGMVVGLNDQYIVKSNRETGFGRADVVLIPRDVNQKGLIIEFKKYSLDEDKDLKDSAYQALQQIEEKDYEAVIKSHGIDEVIKVGIAFKGKRVEIASNLDQKVTRLSEKEEIAKEMLKKDMDINLIIELTGLNRNQVKNLQE